jgi:hypothetical protein
MKIAIIIAFVVAWSPIVIFGFNIIRDGAFQ